MSAKKKFIILLLIFFCVLGAGIGNALFRAYNALPRFEERVWESGQERVTLMVIPLADVYTTGVFAEDRNDPKTVREWRALLGADIVINGSYFDKDFAPTGYWQKNETTSSVPWPTLKEQQDPYSYTFALHAEQDGFALAYLPDSPQEHAPSGDVLLSFPTLLINGNPLVKEDSGKQARRTVIAEDANGADYIVITKKGEITLFELAQWLSEQPEHFVIAGNLDGGPSTGISWERGWFDVEIPSVAVPNVVVIRKSPQQLP